MVIALLLAVTNAVTTYSEGGYAMW